MSAKVHSRPALTGEYIRQILDYDQQTGDFTWLTDRSAQAKAGARAGTINGKGYRAIMINRRLYEAQRLAFMWMLGRWPVTSVDHINRRPADNAWANLREATQAQNMVNCNPKRKKHPELPPGVNKLPSGRFQAAFGRGGYLGVFDTAEAARTAYLHAVANRAASEFLPK